MVTGGAGYIGCRLVPALVNRGAYVLVVDKMIFGEDGLNGVRDHIDVRHADVRSLRVADLKGFDAVIHLAGLSNDPTSEFNPAANQAINFRATAQLARSAKEAGVKRFVFASSCSVYYTESADGGIRIETDHINPQRPYSWSKHQAERSLLELTDSDFCTVVLRKGTVFGCSPRMRYDLVVNTFTRDAFVKRRLNVQAGGRMWRPLLHIDDAVDAYISVLKADPSLVCGQIFNVLSGNYQVLAIAQEVRLALERKSGIKLELDVQPTGLSRSYQVDGRKFCDTFGVALSRSVSDAAKEMWDVVVTTSDLDNPIYYNIEWLELLTDMERRLKQMGGGPL